jgi:hypothetical protein
MNEPDAFVWDGRKPHFVSMRHGETEIPMMASEQ